MKTREYEGMFLLNNHAAQADFDATAGKVDAILEKHGASIIQKEKWDERKLAYEIKGQRRATYYLVYFSSPPSAMEKIREDLHLTEDVLRYMAFVLEEPVAEHIQKRTDERERLAEDSRRHSLSGWGGGGGRRRRDRPRRDDGDRRDRGGEGGAPAASAAGAPNPAATSAAGEPPAAAASAAPNTATSNTATPDGTTGS